MRDTYSLFAHTEQCSLHGETFMVTSWYKPGTFGFWSDAVQAAKCAGAYKMHSDGRRIELCGKRLACS